MFQCLLLLTLSPKGFGARFMSSQNVKSIEVVRDLEGTAATSVRHGQHTSRAHRITLLIPPDVIQIITVQANARETYKRRLVLLKQHLEHIQRRNALRAILQVRRFCYPRIFGTFDPPKPSLHSQSLRFYNILNVSRALACWMEYTRAAQHQERVNR